MKLAASEFRRPPISRARTTGRARAAPESSGYILSLARRACCKAAPAVRPAARRGAPCVAGLRFPTKTLRATAAPASWQTQAAARSSGLPRDLKTPDHGQAASLFLASKNPCVLPSFSPSVCPLSFLPSCFLSICEGPEYFFGLPSFLSPRSHLFCLKLVFFPIGEEVFCLIRIPGWGWQQSKNASHDSASLKALGRLYIQTYERC